MEYLSGGELYDYVTKNPRGLPEAQAAGIMQQLVSSVAYLHHAGIVHRDLKLENFLFDRAGGSVVKLIDFGFSQRYRIGSENPDDDGPVELRRMHSVVGTPY